MSNSSPEVEVDAIAMDLEAVWHTVCECTAGRLACPRGQRVEGP